MVIGGGTVYPELNFTLPDLAVDAAHMPTVVAQYREMITDALNRAVALQVPGLVVEFETLPPMTEHPDWAMQIVDVLLEALAAAYAKHALKSVLRVTPNDNREFERPAKLRSGRHWDAMLELFERAAAAGAELLSIESMGGKEIHDDALQFGNLSQVIFAQCVLGARDMRFVWSHLVPIARKHSAHAAGDTACAFGNTAMILAEQGMIARVFAAVVRAISAVRSLVAYECGAVGPGKDCGYENIILKAITGYPMAGEGKSAACAHLSPIGNVAAAACDTWSNESVQNVRLLGGMAPTCMLESLSYDCRLMNEALSDGDAAARKLRDWLVRGDVKFDPQAYILSPDSAGTAGATAGRTTESLPCRPGCGRRGDYDSRERRPSQRIDTACPRASLVGHHAGRSCIAAKRRAGVCRRSGSDTRTFQLPASRVWTRRLATKCAMEAGGTAIFPRRLDGYFAG